MEKLNKATKSANIASIINGLFSLLMLFVASAPCGAGIGECGPEWPFYLVVIFFIFLALLPQILLFNFKKKVQEIDKLAEQENRYLLPTLEFLKYAPIIYYIILMTAASLPL